METPKLHLSSERVLSLLPWNRCNAKCAHCGPRSGPEDATEISHEKCLELIEEAKEIYGKGWCLTLSGGEIFLYYDRLRDYVAAAKAGGGYTTLITNCYWARTVDAALSKLEPLVENDLKVLGISLTAFHREFVPADRVRNAIEAASRLKLKVRVRSVASRRTRLWELLRDVEGAHPWFVDFMEMPLVPHGRAEILPADDLILSRDLPRGKCPAASLTINPAGKAMACCNGGGDLPLLQIGDIDSFTLEQLEYLFASDPTISFLVNQGPAECIGFLDEEEQRDYVGRRFVNECDLCISLFKEEKCGSKIKNSIESKFTQLTRDLLPAGV